MWGMGTTQDDLPKNPHMGLEKEAAIKTISVEYGFERWPHENLISDQDSCQDVGSFGRRNRAGYSPDMLMRSKPRAMKTIKLVEQSMQFDRRFWGLGTSKSTQSIQKGCWQTPRMDADPLFRDHICSWTLQHIHWEDQTLCCSLVVYHNCGK